MNFIIEVVVTDRFHCITDGTKPLPDYTWTNVDLSSKVPCDIQLRAISQEVFMNKIRNMCLEITRK